MEIKSSATPKKEQVFLQNYQLNIRRETSIYLGNHYYQGSPPCSGVGQTAVDTKYIKFTEHGEISTRGSQGIKVSEIGSPMHLASNCHGSTLGWPTAAPVMRLIDGGKTLP